MTAIISIDRAGRVVLPKKAREQFQLHPGSLLELTAAKDHLQLRPLDLQPALLREGNLWVHQGSASVPLADTLRQVRDERARDTGR